MHCEQPIATITDMPAIPDIDKPAIEGDISIVTNPKRTKIDLIDIDESSDEDLHLAIYGGAKQAHLAAQPHVDFSSVPCRVSDAHCDQVAQDPAPGFNYKTPILIPNAFAHLNSLRNHTKFTLMKTSIEPPATPHRDLSQSTRSYSCNRSFSTCPALGRETCRACVRKSDNGSNAEGISQT